MKIGLWFSVLLLVCGLPARSPAADGSLPPGKIHLPPGFRISVFASGLGEPRFLAFSPRGVLFVSIPRRGTVVALPDENGDGKADRAVVFARHLNLPHGLAFFRGALYVADTNAVVRLETSGDELRTGGRKVIVPDLPSAGVHWTRTIGFGPDGKMYVSVGSSCNLCEEKDPRRAAILRFNPDGSGAEIYARGLRNAVGFVWQPGTGEMWATDNGRDMLGDDLPPDEIDIVRAGADYGWPYCYGDRLPEKEYHRADFCRTTVPPAVALQAHSAPLGLVFYTGTMFPAGYRGDLFVALHGSWNRSVPTGYKVIRIPMKKGKPGKGQDFATGWLVHGSAWGRPVDPAVGPDGALYLSDDRAGVIYRITYGSR